MSTRNIFDLLYIHKWFSFTGNIKLMGIVIIGGENQSAPSKVRLFKNRPHMTFDDAALKSDQEFDLAHTDSNGIIEYATKYIDLCFHLTYIVWSEDLIVFVRIVTFSSVHHLTLHFPSNFGSETTKIYYIGLKGEWSPGHKHGVTLCTYEATPSMADHKDKIIDTNVSNIYWWLNTTRWNKRTNSTDITAFTW